MSLSAPEDAFLDVNDAHLRVYGNVHADGLKLGQLEVVTTTSTGSTIQFLHQHTAFTTTSNIEVGTTNHDLFVDTNASKVGILTNTPTTALDVNGTVKATAFDGDGALLTGIPSSAINGTLSQWTTVAGPKIHYSDGNVGIGVADPTEALDVLGNINFSGILKRGGAEFVSTPWTIESGPTALSYTLGNVGVGGTTPSAKLEVTGNAHVSTDLSVGEKIGVGVDSPDANLHVVGNCHVSTNMELGGTLVMGTVTVEAQHALSAITATGNTTPHTIEFQNAETSLVTTGNVQVGKELTVTGDATFDTNTLKIDTNNNRVGIGTATPDYKLDVNGDIRGGCPVFFTAYAGNGSNATVTGSTGGTVIIFSNTTVNKGGAYDISNGRCTFPISGYYEIFFRGGTASTVDFHAKIYRNGDAPGTNGWPNHLPRLWDNSDRQFRNAGTIQFFYYFAVGEYIDVRLTNSSVFNADNYNSFSVKYLSN